jgi:glutamate racemase
MRIALINSGIGLLATAAQLHRLRPDADLVLAMDPDWMPWGPRPPRDIVRRSLACARAAAEYRPDVLVVACNSGSVHALDALRAEFEPAIPVIGTVPAVKPAAAAADSIAIWATVATTASACQRRLIADHAAATQVAAVACPGLADAIDAGDDGRIRAAVTDAASRTPADCDAVVLGCTEYELAADWIGAAVPAAALFGSAAAVAAQALRRAATAGSAVPTASSATAMPTTATSAALASMPTAHSSAAAIPARTGTATLAHSAAATPTGEAALGTLRVLLSGRIAELPAAALNYPEGRLLARVAPARDPDAARPGRDPDAARPGRPSAAAPRRSVPA